MSPIWLVLESKISLFWMNIVDFFDKVKLLPSKSENDLSNMLCWLDLTRLSCCLMLFTNLILAFSSETSQILIELLICCTQQPGTTHGIIFLIFAKNLTHSVLITQSCMLCFLFQRGDDEDTEFPNREDDFSLPQSYFVEEESWSTNLVRVSVHFCFS